MADFFSALRKKISRKPGRAADRAFWKKFEAEFGGRRRWSWTWPKLVPALATILVAFGGYWIWRGQEEAWDPNDPGQSKLGEAAMAAHQDLFNEMDVLAEFDDESLPMDDAEWDLLTGEEEAG